MALQQLGAFVPFGHRYLQEKVPPAVSTSATPAGSYFLLPSLEDQTQEEELCWQGQQSCHVLHPLWNLYTECPLLQARLLCGAPPGSCGRPIPSNILWCRLCDATSPHRGYASSSCKLHV
jgi:hypothetical protein